MSAISQQFERIIGADHVHPWESLEASRQTGFLTALRPGDRFDCLVCPPTEVDLAAVMACAHQHRWRVLPCGNGSKLQWGGLTESIQVIVSTSQLNRLIDHAVGDLTVTAEAGMGFAALQARLEAARQFLAIAPTYPSQATLGGIIATADTGSLRQRYGGVRDMLIGISFVRADGQIAKAGGRVVKNVAGYDLMKLFTGSYGTLGIISQATFRVYPLPEASQTVVLLGEMEAIAQATRTLMISVLTPTDVELISPQISQQAGLGNDLGLVVRFQSIAISVKTQAEALLKVGQVLNLQSTMLTREDEKQVWQILQQQAESTPDAPIIFCKVGVLPSHAVTFLDKVNTLIPNSRSLIHAGSGLGIIRCPFETVQTQTLTTLRQICRTQGGFLTILEAPLWLKQTFDLWGYSGNALPLMQNMKKQFDPDGLLSPHRFIS